jgi:hypothetical protein
MIFISYANSLCGNTRPEALVGKLCTRCVLQSAYALLEQLRKPIFQSGVSEQGLETYLWVVLGKLVVHQERWREEGRGMRNTVCPTVKIFYVSPNALC